MALTFVSDPLIQDEASAGRRCWDAEKVDVFVRVTSVSGISPALRLRIQTTDVVDLNQVAESDWVDIQTFPLINQVGQEMTTVQDNLCRHIRLYADLSGTSPQFSLSAWMVKHLKFIS